MSTMIAVASPPTIVCPDWCIKSEALHLERLAESNGLVEHDSEPVDGFSRTTITFVDGTPVPGTEVLIYSDDDRLDGLTVAEAETFARQILAAVEEARA